MKQNDTVSDIKAIILAGGKGTRLAPYTTVFPKPMVPLGHQPILEILIGQLVSHGITDITICLGYLGELIQAYFQNQTGWLANVNLSYVKESQPMGTAGSISLVPDLDDTFLVMNGDILTTLNFSHLIAYHRKNEGALTIGMYPKQVNIDLGVIKTDNQSRLIGYEEKPKHHYNVSMGIYVYEPAVLKYIKPGRHLDFPDLVLTLIKNKQPVVGYPFNDYWLDIGRHEDYAQAQQEFDQIKHRLYSGPVIPFEGRTYVEASSF